MPDKDSLIGKTLRGVKAVGLGKTLQVAFYPLRRAYHEAKFGPESPRGSILRGVAGLFTAGRKRPAPEVGTAQDWTFAGNLLDHQLDGQTLTLHCQNATLQLRVLAADLIRVRFSPAGQTAGHAGPARPSYATCRQDAEWAPVSCTVSEGPDELEMRTPRLVCRIARQPCQLSFHDTQGQLIHADSAGLAWQGRQAARFAALTADEHLYGLGERAFPLDLRGHSYTLWNVDPQDYTPGRDPLYLSIPFCIGMHAGQGYGILYENTCRARLDLGETHPDEAVYVAENGGADYYFVYGPALGTVLERYTELTGRMALPPLWALGYQQSRWSYYPESRVREIAQIMRDQRIPCDVLYLDIHYMDGYRSFTWDKRRFPEPARMLADLHEQGFRVVAAVDPHIKADRHYAVCADGLAHDVFCRYPDGGLAGGPVWPGESYFPDLTNPRVRQWWGEQFAPLLQAGLDGFWNDMDEPTVIGPQGDSLAVCVQHDWEGQRTDHGEAHNVYGLLTARSTAEGLQRLRPDRRPFVLTRSGWAGVQRYALHWTGDNLSTWEHLQLTMPMVLNLGLSGLAFTGADVGGFDGDAGGELVLRWTQMGAFLPFFRNHSSLWSSNQEPWAFGEPYLSWNRAAIELRYRMLPYLYTATWQCAQSGTPIARPLLWAYPDDPLTHTLDDQFLCGDALLVAPISQPGRTSRQVYLPAGEWFDFWTDERHTGPRTLTTAAPFERIPVFVRAGTVLPTWPVLQHTNERPVDRLILHVYAGDGESWLYEDDGQSMAYRSGEYRVTRFGCRIHDDNSLTITRTAQGPYSPAYSHWEWTIHGLSSRPQQVLVDGLPLPEWSWDEVSHILSFASGQVDQIETH